MGRHKDGRYMYRSISVMYHARNVVALTHEQRVGLAVCKAIALLARPGVSTDVYPMTRERGALGYGSYNASRVWLQRPLLAGIGREYLAGTSPTMRHMPGRYCQDALDTLAHEMGHNTQKGGKPHGPEFREADAKMRTAILNALVPGWPKVPMSKLRDSVGPAQRKAATKRKRKEVAACESRSSKWSKKVASAEQLLATWEAKQSAAANRVTKWRKALAHAERHLARAQDDEGNIPR